MQSQLKTPLSCGADGEDWMAEILTEREFSPGPKEIGTGLTSSPGILSTSTEVRDKKPDPWGGYLITKQRTACH